MKPLAHDPKAHPNEMEYLYTLAEVAAYFRVSHQTVRVWSRENKIKAYRLPPQDGDRTIPAGERRSMIYFTRTAMLEWAAHYYKLN